MWASNANNHFLKRRNKRITGFHVYILNILKIKLLNSGPSTSWQKRKKKNIREKVETVRDFLFLGSKTTVDSDSSHEIKRPFSYDEKLWQT